MNRSNSGLQLLVVIGGLVVITGCRTTKEAVKANVETPSTGTMTLTINATDPKVTIDGQPAGAGKQGPYKAGPHALHVEADGYTPVDQSVTVVDNQDSPVTIAMKKLPGTVQLTVNVDADCDIAGDHQKVTAHQPATFQEPAGLVQVLCRAPGYREANQLVGIKAGRTITQEIALSANVRVEPLTGLEFVWLPGGNAHVGCAAGDSECAKTEPPNKTAPVSSLWMGKTEVPEAAYRKCVADGACAVPKSAGKGSVCNYKDSKKEKHPINCLSWEEAGEFCSWIGGRLPTLDEWEYAARSGHDQVYPWGSTPVGAARANYCEKACHHRAKGEKEKAEKAPPPPSVRDADEGTTIPPEAQNDNYTNTAPVGSFPAGATQDGVLDMAGNVAEWTSTNVEVKSEGDKNEKKTVSVKWTAGGSWADAPSDLRVSAGKLQEPKYRADTLGVRCVLK